MVEVEKRHRVEGKKHLEAKRRMLLRNHTMRHVLSMLMRSSNSCNAH
jgi:hypothetical protein